MNKIKLGDICSIKKGKKVEQTEQSNNSIRYIQIEDLRNNDYIKFCEKKENYVIANPSDIIIAWDGANAGTIGFGLNGAIGSTLAILELNRDDLDTGFIGLLLRGMFTYLRSNCTGATIPHINRRSLEEIRIPLLPLETQKQIAKNLNTVSELLSMRKQQLTELDNLIKSVFYDMFGDPVLNTKGWKIEKVIDICGCMVPGRDKPKSFSGEIPWITIDDLIVNGITYKSKSSLGLTKYEIDEVKRKRVPTGSVLMSCVGNLGICSLAGKPLVINQQLHSFQCGGKVNNFYLMHYLGQRKGFMNKNASNTTVLYMNKSKCNSIPVMLPPIDLQNQFASIVTKAEAQKSLVKKSIEETQLLFDSLMSQYFD